MNFVEDDANCVFDRKTFSIVMLKRLKLTPLREDPTPSRCQSKGSLIESKLHLTSFIFKCAVRV